MIKSRCAYTFFVEFVRYHTGTVTICKIIEQPAYNKCGFVINYKNVLILRRFHISVRSLTTHKLSLLSAFLFYLSYLF